MGAFATNHHVSGEVLNGRAGSGRGVGLSSKMSGQLTRVANIAVGVAFSAAGECRHGVGVDEIGSGDVHDVGSERGQLAIHAGPTEAAGFRREIAAIRRRGYAISDGLADPEIRAGGVPVFERGLLVGVVVVVGSRTDTGRAVDSAARRVREWLAGQWGL